MKILVREVSRKIQMHSVSRVYLTLRMQPQSYKMDKQSFIHVVRVYSSSIRTKITQMISGSGSELIRVRVLQQVEHSSLSGLIKEVFDEMQ